MWNKKRDRSCQKTCPSLFPSHADPSIAIMRLVYYRSVNFGFLQFRRIGERLTTVGIKEESTYIYINRLDVDKGKTRTLYIYGEILPKKSLKSEVNLNDFQLFSRI